MRYFAVFFVSLLSTVLFAQDKQPENKVFGKIVNDKFLLPLSNVNIININKVRGTASKSNGDFEIEATVNDTLHISMIGFQSIKVKVTNDWVKNGTAKIKLTEKAIALEEIIIRKYSLTGYLEVDTKLIPERENYRYSISGLPTGYETGEYSPNAFSRVVNSIFNPADMLYNLFGKKSNELKRLKEFKKDSKMKDLLESKFDRETISVLLGINKKDIAEVLQHCSYSDSFIETANDLQILDAINQCYEQYKVLKKK